MSTVHASEQNGHRGWIEDTNRFKLERPPDWFLTGLVNYDANLVLIPSRLRRQYLLCRRRQYTVGLGDVAMVDNKHPDTNMCYAYGVLPIAPLASRSSSPIQFTQQNLLSLLETLRERDAWAAGGGPQSHDPEAVADAVDAFDRDQEARQDAALRDNFYHRSRDAWRSLQARMGWRNRRASDYHGVARAPQTEQRVMLTDAPPTIP